MSELNLDVLEDIALEATQGPWTLTDDEGDGMHDIAAGPKFEHTAYLECSRVDADHIAAFNPETVLALIAEIRSLLRARQTVAKLYGITLAERDALQAKLDKVLEENADLRAEFMDVLNTIGEDDVQD